MKSIKKSISGAEAGGIAEQKQTAHAGRVKPHANPVANKDARTERR